ncbi:FeoB-associated Cys-rich membrane protein [Deltaproteobacteria bacterium TL4]
MGAVEGMVLSVILGGAVFYLYRTFKKSTSGGGCGCCNSEGCDSSVKLNPSHKN